MNDTAEKRAIETLFPPAPGVSVDELFALLADERRQALIAVLASHDGPVDVNELTRAVAALETDDDVTDAHESDLRRIRLTLHHVHLPKMADYGVISYDPDRRTVMLADGLIETNPDVDAVPSHR